MTKNIASSWAKVFESDLFASFEKSTKAAIEKLLKEIENSAPVGLKDRTKGQGLVCQEEANVALNKTLDLVKETMNNEQKEVSRLISYVLHNFFHHDNRLTHMSLDLMCNNSFSTVTIPRTLREAQEVWLVKRCVYKSLRFLSVPNISFRKLCMTGSTTSRMKSLVALLIN